jgi:hypothetical protein
LAAAGDALSIFSSLPVHAGCEFRHCHLGKLLPDGHFRRGIAHSPDCPFCPNAETNIHMLLHCPSTQTTWNALSSLNIDVSSCSYIPELWGHTTKQKVQSTVLIAILWNI